jgi:hypothetical protein
MEEFRVRFYAPAGNLDALLAESTERLTALSTGFVPQDAESFSRVLDAMAAGDPTLAETFFVSCWPQPPGLLGEPELHLLGLVSIPDFTHRHRIRRAIDQVLQETADRHGAAYDLAYTFTNPPLHNDPGLVTRAMPLLESCVGQERLLVLKAPYPFAHEDFTHYAAQVPSLFVWLGTQNLEEGIPSILHTPGYDIDEDALGLGVEAMTAVIRGLLAEPGSHQPRMSLQPPETTPS